MINALKKNHYRSHRSSDSNLCQTHWSHRSHQQQTQPANPCWSKPTINRSHPTTMPRSSHEPNPTPMQALNEKERCEMRERVRTERKRDSAKKKIPPPWPCHAKIHHCTLRETGSRRRRDKVGVRERGLKNTENKEREKDRWNKKTNIFF